MRIARVVLAAALVCGTAGAVSATPVVPAATDVNGVAVDYMKKGGKRYKVKYHKVKFKRSKHYRYHRHHRPRHHRFRYYGYHRPRHHGIRYYGYYPLRYYGRRCDCRR